MSCLGERGSWDWKGKDQEEGRGQKVIRDECEQSTLCVTISQVFMQLVFTNKADGGPMRTGVTSAMEIFA